MTRTVSFAILFSFIFATNVLALCPTGKKCIAIQLDSKCVAQGSFIGVCTGNKCKVGTKDYAFPYFYVSDSPIVKTDSYHCEVIEGNFLGCIYKKNYSCCNNDYVMAMGPWNNSCMEDYCECDKELTPACECANMECGMKACGKDCGACPSGYTCEKGFCNKADPVVDESACPEGEKCFAVTVDDSCLVDTANQGVCANGSCYAKSKYIPYPYFYVTDKSVNSQENFDCSFLITFEDINLEKFICVVNKNGACCDWDTEDGSFKGKYWNNDCMEAYCQCNGGLDCGGCAPGYTCKAGACEKNCIPSCVNKDCGNNGCGGSCGNCTDGKSCTNNKCLDTCTPKCSGKQCGSNGCGGSCGTCLSGKKCNEGQCVSTCIPSCNGKDCGNNDCGGSCGNCSDGKSCINNKCLDKCTPQCNGKQCGSNGCGGNCGECFNDETCISGKCTNDWEECDNECDDDYDECKYDCDDYTDDSLVNNGCEKDCYNDFDDCNEECDEDHGQDKCQGKCNDDWRDEIKYCSNQWNQGNSIWQECIDDANYDLKKCSENCDNWEYCGDGCSPGAEGCYNDWRYICLYDNNNECWKKKLYEYCSGECSVINDETACLGEDGFWNNEGEDDSELIPVESSLPTDGGEDPVSNTETDDDEESSETEVVVFVFDDEGNIHLVDEEGKLEFCDPELGVMKFNLEEISKKRQEQSFGKNCSMSLQKTSTSNKPLLILISFALFVIFSRKRVKQ